MDAATLTYDSLRFGEIEDFPETSEPVWILGQQFSALTEKDEILADVTSRLWLTYRKNFQPIGGTGPTSDTGWGCMLRCGQMILGQALICRHLGRERLCMPWLDFDRGACAISEEPREMNGDLEGACALAEEETALWKPLVLLIPLRLGLSDINEAYIEPLKQCFMMPQSLGVIGGKPNSAHYFIGFVGDELIFLDPHTTQPAVDPNEDGQFPDDSYHCQHPPCRMHICELDPSIAAGFFCQTEDDFDDWCAQIRKVSNCRGLPMFELVDSQPSHLITADVLNLTPDFSDSDRLERFFDSEDEEFEILSL
ncbi:cysteine protease ATG4B isoform X1 [Labeo rohita]|uniref:Cysteine protease n=1 Tax=Labeo rohita TaxID=84645 RepID=A0A498L8T0_LABRO|nr:cysteine protease ATG4B isoform X1 [Labeo rohita]